MNRIVFNFIHGSAPRDRSVPGRLSREVLARPPAHGGAGVPNVAESASANRFRVLSRVASGTNSSLTTIATAAHFRPEAVLAAGNLLWMSPDALKFARSPEAAQWLRLVRTHANQAPLQPHGVRTVNPAERTWSAMLEFGRVPRGRVRVGGARARRAVLCSQSA